MKTKYVISKWIDYGLLAFIVGAIVGVVDVIFALGIEFATKTRLENPRFFTWLLPIAGVVIVYLYQKYGKDSKRGMGLVFSVGFGNEKVMPKRMVPFAIISTWLTHLFGGSAGREGVAVQIGADIAQNFGKVLPFKDASRIFLITGMAAGFSGLFGTPLAAILFAIEVLTVGKIEYKALYTCFIASYTAFGISNLLGIRKSTCFIMSDSFISPLTFFKLILLGVIFGILGRIFAIMLLRGKNFFSKLIRNPLQRVFVFGLLLSVIIVVMHNGRYSGVGENLIEIVFNNEEVYLYDWILKMILTITTLSIGFQGGEVTPMFSIGATFGAIIAPLFGLPKTLVAALGYVGVFGAATNTFFTSILVGGEIFGFQYLPHFFIVCAISHIASGSVSIYSLQKSQRTV